MGKGRGGSGTTRGDRRRKREAQAAPRTLPRDGAVIGIDPAEGEQVIAWLIMMCGC